MRIAVNGFGRIGRNFVRALMEDAQAQKKIAIAAINIGPADLKRIDYMFKYDTLMGTYPGVVKLKGSTLHIDDLAIPIIAECSPTNIDWKAHNIDWVVDCSGCFTSRDGAMCHIKSGAQKVLISAPAKDEDVTIIPGVNDAAYNPEKDKIVALGSCTTNALLPLAKCLHDAFTIEQGFMTTVHAYTNTQVLLDVETRGDIRRSRAAALNIIPTTTGAMKVLGKVMPELDGKLNGMAMRVPVGKVSIIDLVIHTKKTMSVDTIHDAIKKTANGSMKGIMNLSMEPLVSCDYNGTNYSVVVDGLLTEADGNMAKVLGWYDNEWGYSVRLKDFLLGVLK